MKIIMIPMAIVMTMVMITVVVVVFGESEICIMLVFRPL